MNDDTAAQMNYPISQHINIRFNGFEDRLVVTAQRIGDAGQVTMLLSRRMVLLMLTNVLNKLPELTGLEKTPANYWQEVMQMGHQHAMEAKKQTDMDTRAQAQAQAQAKHERATVDVAEPPAAEPVSGELTDTVYLATELTLNTVDRKLTLAFRGVPMPDTLGSAGTAQPIFALPLQVDNVHQLIELLIVKCQEAQWHLPLELPWTELPNGGGGSRKDSLRPH
jgi:hypothetical protein